MGVAMANPHPYVANKSFLATCRPHANFLPDWSMIIFSANKISFGCGYGTRILIKHMPNLGLFILSVWHTYIPTNKIYIKLICGPNSLFKSSFRGGGGGGGGGCTFSLTHQWEVV